MRAPNPWIAVPSAVAGLVGGFIGWVVADVACRADADIGESCFGSSMATALASFILVGLGVAVVLVLVYRSVAEYREATEKGEEPPGPGCEV